MITFRQRYTTFRIASMLSWVLELSLRYARPISHRLVDQDPHVARRQHNTYHRVNLIDSCKGGFTRAPIDNNRTVSFGLNLFYFPNVHSVPNTKVRSTWVNKSVWTHPNTPFTLRQYPRSGLSVKRCKKFTHVRWHGNPTQISSWVKPRSVPGPAAVCLGYFSHWGSHWGSIQQ